MRKIIVALFVSIFLVSFAAQVYEKIVFKSGNWLVDQQEVEGKQILLVRYEGSLKFLQDLIPARSQRTVKFNMDSDTVLKSIYFVCEPAKDQKIYIESQEKVFGPYQASRIETGEYVFELDSEILLKKGSYSLKFSDPSILVQDPLTGPAVLVIGVDAELFKSNLKKEAQTNTPTKAVSVSGTSSLFENKPAQKLTPTAQVQRKPIQFTLNQSTFLEEIAIDLLVEPKDFPKTHILIYDKNNKPYGPYYAEELDEAHGIIFFTPSIVLEAGTYTVRLSDESAMNYEKDGRPIYALKSFPYDPPFDFTGSYKINFKIVRTRTLRGPSEKTTLEVKLFDIGVIDRGEFIELVGKVDLEQVVKLLEEQTGRKVQASYEGQVFPFSQACEIVERTKDSVKCQFPLQLNFTDMPFVNRFIIGETSALVTFIFKTRPGLTPGVTILGYAKYVRMDDPHLGTDINDYVINGDGYRYMENLPPFVIFATTRKLGSAGNIPGPSSPEQAAVGLLFPPLVSVIGYALQELLKPKPGGVAETFADYTRARRGAARRAAAREAAGEGTITSTEESGETEASEELEEEYEGAPVEETVQTETFEVSQEATAPEKVSVGSEKPSPVTVSVVVDHSGRIKEVTYDPQTGEWITEDGNLFNWEVYEKIVLPNLEKERSWIEQQREKMMQPTEIEKMKDDAREEYIRNLEKKYGVSREQLKNVISQSMDKNAQAAEEYKREANKWDFAYKAAKIGQIVADNAVDGLAACTGMPGKAVRAIYKAAKAFVPDEEDKGITLGKAISTGTDIASDFIGFSNPWKEAAFKTAGSTIGGTVDKGWEGFKESLVDSAVSNSFEAFAKVIGGKGYGDDVTKYRSSWWNPELSNLDLRFPKSNDEILRSPTGKSVSTLVAGKLFREFNLQSTKTAAMFTSEMLVKPLIKND